MAIARALIDSPIITMADEPTGNMNFAKRADRIAELVDGRIAAYSIFIPFQTSA